MHRIIALNIAKLPVNLEIANFCSIFANVELTRVANLAGEDTDKETAFFQILRALLSERRPS